MMNKKILLSLAVIAFVFALTIGGTMAWFTDTATIEPNVFTAGTVEIEANESWAEDFEVENWNPGDCTDKEVSVKVTGTKRAYVRMKFDEQWYENIAEEEAEANWVVFNPNPDVDPIRIKLNEKSFPDEVDHWVKVGDWYYYLGVGNPGDATGIEAISEVCLHGPTAGNQFQGKKYELGFDFEAIQVTHEATFSEAGWGVGYIDYNESGLVVNGWYTVTFENDVWKMVVESNTFVWDDPGYDANGDPLANYLGWTLQS